MTNRQWLKQEINQWVDDGVITDEEGKELSARYKHAGPYPYREAFFFLAAVCILGGLFFLGAGLWNGLTQDQRFLLAMGPLLVSFLLMLAVVLVDKKIPDPDVMEPDYRGTSLSDEILGFGGVSDSDAFESVDKIGKKAGLMAKIASGTRTVPAKTWHHRVPAFIREAEATLHGFCLLGAFWMVSDSFQLSSDMYSGLALCALLLLLMCIVTSSGGLGILYMACSVGIFYTAPERGWPEIVSWIFMMIALLLMARMLHERRDKALVLFSWGWAVGILLLIFWSAGNMLWQTLFFSLAAALTWMAGGEFRAYGIGAQAMRFFGGVAVFAVLLEGAYGAVWQNISGSFFLWAVFIFFLVIDAILLFRMGTKAEWLSILAGMTPFIMGLAAIAAIFDPAGAFPPMIVSVYTGVLAIGVILRGYQMDRPAQQWSGFLLLCGGGAIRVIDSALSYGERGAFFIAAGLLSAFICYILYLPGKKKRKKKVKARPSAPLAEQEGKEDESHDK